VEPDDILDPLSGLCSGPWKEFSVEQVRLGSATTIRGMMQSRKPGVDVVLFDFSEPRQVQHLIDLPKSVPGVVFFGAVRPFAPGPSLSAWRRAGIVPLREWPLSVLLSCDTDEVGAVLGAKRPIAVPLVAPEAENDGAAPYRVTCFGSPDALYAALLAWQNWHQRPDQAHLILVAGSPFEANVARESARALGVFSDVVIEIVPSRMEVAALCRRATVVLDIDPLAQPGLTDPLLAAGAFGIPHRRIDGPKAETCEQVRMAYSDLQPRAAAERTRAQVAFQAGRSERAFLDILSRAVSRSRTQSRLHEAAL
jgi:hypothetical protein